MKWIVQWAMPIAFVIIGIAVGFGWILPQIPPQSGLRPVFAVVIVLLGIHRFVVSRTPVRGKDRRFGGDRDRPWEQS